MHQVLHFLAALQEATAVVVVAVALGEAASKKTLIEAPHSILLWNPSRSLLKVSARWLLIVRKIGIMNGSWRSNVSNQKERSEIENVLFVEEQSSST
jgi:hypothetical protein